MELEDIIKEENIVFKKTKLLNDKPLSYCPGCGHGTVHRILMETIEELGIDEETIGIAPVGCAVMAYEFMEIDMQEAAHGRAPALATGIKRVYPKKYVFTYQGDGDLAAIGTAETMHCCNRGENILIIFINNGIYGMTGGQMAPTTLEGAKTSTSPYGRDVSTMGYPIRITELIAQLPAVRYVTRQSVHTPAAVRKAKAAIKKAFEYQAEGRQGTCFIEFLSNCNSGWKMSPAQANKWMEENTFKYYVPGDIKDNFKLLKNPVVEL